MRADEVLGILLGRLAFGASIQRIKLNTIAVSSIAPASERLRQRKLALDPLSNGRDAMERMPFGGDVPRRSRPVMERSELPLLWLGPRGPCRARVAQATMTRATSDIMPPRHRSG